jgi:hypothetical protein
MTTQTLRRLLCFLFVSIFGSTSSARDASFPVLKSASGQEAILVEKAAENSYLVYFRRGSAKKEKIWMSFFGLISGAFSTDGRFVAIQDGMRFCMLSPILVFKLSNNSVELVYESPGSFELEENLIDFSISSFDGPILNIAILRNKFSGKRSRPIPSKLGSYSVNCAGRRPLEGPHFYAKSDPLYFNVNAK